MLQNNKGRLKKSLRQSFLLVVLFVLILLVIGQTNSLSAQSQEQTPTIKLPEEALAAPLNFALPGSAPSLEQTKLDRTLLQLQNEGVRSTGVTRGTVWTNDLKIVDDRVQTRIVVDSKQLQEAEQAIRAAGGQITSVSKVSAEIQAWIPVDSLESFEEEPSIQGIHRPATLVPLDVGKTAALTEGFAPLGVQSWHDAGERGAGAKIAVIDGGFSGYKSLLGSDLPNGVTVKNFVDGQSDSQVGSTTETPHGTACTEIIYDIAPEAQYYLLKVATNLDLEQAVNYAIGQGVDVISTSIGWYNLTPGDGSGQFADLVNLARANGIIWLTAAGNDRLAHWGGYFSDPDSDGYHNFNGLQEINYYGPGNGDGYVIQPGTVIRVFLRWDDWQDVDQDFALHLVALTDTGLQLLATSDDPQEGKAGNRPTEEIEGQYLGPATPIGFYIERTSGSRNVNFEIFAPQVYPLDEYVPERSLPNLADAEAAVTVGAIDFNAPFEQESYSAEGPTNGPGGSLSGGFVKPDLAGYTGVSTETYGTLTFAGTSASAPHVAGAAALIKGAKPSYSPDDIQDMLQRRALDLGTSGVDTQFGHGRIFLWLPPGSTEGLDQHAYLPVAIR